MNAEKKVEELKFIIERFDHYYDCINNKGNLYLTLNTFILAGCITGYYTLEQSLHFNIYIKCLLLWPMLVSNLLSVVFTLLAIRPFTRSGVSTNHSLLFFANVSQQTELDWKNQWDQLTDEEWQRELQCQSRVLAIGLNLKFKRLNWATLLIASQVLIVIIFSVYLLIF